MSEPRQWAAIPPKIDPANPASEDGAREGAVAGTALPASGNGTSHATAHDAEQQIGHDAPPRRTRQSSTGPYVFGATVVTLMLAAAVGLWAAQTNIAGAVVAQALVVVASNVKKVQHQTGGVVAEIKVKNGDLVKAGDVLIRLDETLTRANLQIVSKQLDELTVRAARLTAERNEASDIKLPDAIVSRLDDPAVAEIVAGERSLFATRRSSLAAQEQQLRERMEQYDQEAGGLDAQREAKAIEIRLIDEQIESLIELEKEKLVTASKMIALRREAARLKGEQATLQSNAAQTRGKIAEIELSVLQKKEEFRTEVVKELREVQAKISELEERQVAAQDQLSRVTIRAPDDGVVHQLTANTVGGVVGTTEPIMLIVPGNEPLVLDARVRPNDRDQVQIGASTYIRFATFNQRTTPELVGTVSRIAADLTEDPRTGEPYFSVRIKIPDAELAKLGDDQLVPGIPADVQITTSDRSALSYLWKPIEDQFAKAFRER